MKNAIEISNNIINDMTGTLSKEQIDILSKSLSKHLQTAVVMDPSKICDTLGKSFMVLDRFLDAKTTYKSSPKTIQAYKNQIFNFIKYIELPLASVTEEHIRMYLQFKSLKISPISVENIRRCLSSFFSWCADHKYISYNPCTKNLVPPLKLPDIIRHDISAEDVFNIKDAASKIEDKLYRLKAQSLLEFLESTGCRVDEIRRLEVKDLDLINSRAKIMGKGSKERWVYLNASCKNRLREYLEYKDSINKKSIYVFSNVKNNILDKPMHHNMLEKITKELGEQCGIPKLTIHIYRRYFASVGTKKNIRPDTLKTLMGHSDYRTTLRYISQSSDDIHSQFDKIY